MGESSTASLVMTGSGTSSLVNLFGRATFVCLRIRNGLLAAVHAPNAGGVFFLAHAKPVSWTELGIVAAGIIGRQPRTIRIPMPVARAVGWCAEAWQWVRRRPGILSRDKIAEAAYASWTCDTRRAAAELGFVAKTGLEEGLARTLDWYKQAGWLK